MGSDDWWSWETEWNTHLNLNAMTEALWKELYKHEDYD